MEIFKGLQFVVEEAPPVPSGHPPQIGEHDLGRSTGEVGGAEAGVVTLTFTFQGQRVGEVAFVSAGRKVKADRRLEPLTECLPKWKDGEARAYVESVNWREALKKYLAKVQGQ